MSNTFFEIIDISKSFPGVKALSDVALSVDKGEVRALVGENGAGKSTLMKILNGNYRMDSGRILFNGQEVKITNPIVAAKEGISIIFQELNLVDELSIAENIFAGRLGKKGKPINWKDVNKKAKYLLNLIVFDVDPRKKVGELSIAGKQMVEIAKALSYEARIILMDEPSATLTQSELDKLFDIIRDMKSKGISVIYISHRLEEVFEICDSVSVMRDGKIVDTRPINELTKDQIVEMMVGREVDQTYPKRTHKIREEVLRVDNLQRKNLNESISFSVHCGEVLGIAGLVGSGRTEAMRALFGVDYISGGDIYINNKKTRIKNPKDAKKAGLAFVTEDRKKEGLVLDYSVRNNIIMANLDRIVSRKLLSKKKEKEVSQEYIELLSIKTPTQDQKVMFLSGGNQQKVVLAKWMNADASIIIMDEPTRGIDVGAKLEIYELINKMAESGKAIILISSELPEVLGMSDRILVMKDNQIVAELGEGSISAIEVMKYALKGGSL